MVWASGFISYTADIVHRETKQRSPGTMLPHTTQNSARKLSETCKQDSRFLVCHVHIYIEYTIYNEMKTQPLLLRLCKKINK